jgi:hypothetical protein
MSFMPQPMPQGPKFSLLSSQYLRTTSGLSQSGRKALAEQKSAGAMRCLDGNDDLSDLLITFKEARCVLNLIESEGAGNEGIESSGLEALIDEGLGTVENGIVGYDLGIKIALQRQAFP